METVKKYMTTKEAAEYLGVSEKHVRYMVAQRKVKFYRLSASERGRVRFLPADLDAAMEGNSVEAGEPLTSLTEK